MSGGIGLILLAAGGSRRLGTPKQLLRDAEGISLLRRAALTATAADCHPVIVVLGGMAAESATELEGLAVEAVVNPDWQTGMASSLKAGLNTITTDNTLDAVVVMLCDQPRVTPELINLLVTTYRSSGHDLVASEYGETVGVPAVFGSTLFAALASLRGDEGARRIIKAYPGPSGRIAFPGGNIDVDTAADWESFSQDGLSLPAAQARPSSSALSAKRD